MITGALLGVAAGALLAVAWVTDEPAAWAACATLAVVAVVRGWLWARFGGRR